MSRAGFVAHLLRAVSATLNIDEKDIQGLSLNNTTLSTRTKLESLDLSNATFVVLRKGKVAQKPNEAQAEPATANAEAPAEQEQEEEEEEGVRKVQASLLFSPCNDSMDINYRCINHETARTIKAFSLGQSLKDLKASIAKNEGVELTDQIAVDLHVRAFPLLYHKKTENLPLGKLGFRELLSGTDETIGLEANMLYVVFRNTSPTTPTKQEWGRFDLSPAWVPFLKKQTDAGMGQLLSALYVISSQLDRNADDANHFLGHFYSFIKFPPAILSFYYLMKNKKVYAEQKAALTSSLLYFFRNLIPRQVCADDSKLFEHSLNCLGFLLSEGKKEYELKSTTFESIALTCPLTFAPLTDPVRITSSKRNQVYNRKSVTDRLEGGPLFMEASPFAAISTDRIMADAKSKLLLLFHPLSDDVIILPNITENQSEGARPFTPQLNEWFKLTAKVSTVKILSITPPLALRTAAAPVLTKDDKSKICVYTGPEPCAVGTAVLYDPLTRASKSVRPDDLAKTLGQAGEAVDNREVLEAIIVCLDISGSMDDYSFARDDNEDELIQVELTSQEVDTELNSLSTCEWLPILKRLYKTKPDEVYEEIGAEGMISKFIVDHHRVKLSRLLMHPFQVIIIDVETWPANSNYLQWLPDTVLSYIYTLVAEAEDAEKHVKPKNALPTPKNPITLYVKSLRGDQRDLKVDRSFTVSQIKRALDPNTPQPGIRLIYQGQILEDGEALSTYGIQDHSVLVAIWSATQVQANANPEEEEVEDQNLQTIKITTEGDETEHDVQVDPLSTIQYLRYQLWEQLELRPSKHSIWQGFQDVDGWAERAYVDESLTVETLLENEEAIRYGPRDRKKVDPRLTRLETVKQLFHAFINRSQAYDYPNHIGLILFNNRCKLACPLTPLFEVFRDHIDKAYANGGTNLYGAINKAGEYLAEFKVKHTKASLRVLCFTDGEDTLCTVQPDLCAKTLQINGVVLDAIMIGEGKNNHILRAMAKATGGYAFAPQTLTEALNLNELETILSISERPPVQIVVPDVLNLDIYANLQKYPLDVCNREVVPSRKMPAALQQPVFSISAALQKATEEASMDLEDETPAAQDADKSTDATAAPAPAANSKERVRHLMKELRALAKAPHPNFDIYPAQENIAFWRVVMEVDEGSHYSGGTWLLYAEFPPEYPLKAPEIRFITPIRHSNVNQYGKICHSIFNRNWTADTTMHTVLQCVYGLMLNPDTDDPLDTNLALSFFSATGDYEAAIMKHVEKYAQKSRKAYRDELQEKQQND